MALAAVSSRIRSTCAEHWNRRYAAAFDFDPSQPVCVLSAFFLRFSVESRIETSTLAKISLRYEGGRCSNLCGPPRHFTRAHVRRAVEGALRATVRIDTCRHGQTVPHKALRVVKTCPPAIGRACRKHRRPHERPLPHRCRTRPRVGRRYHRTSSEQGRAESAGPGPPATVTTGFPVSRRRAGTVLSDSQDVAGQIDRRRAAMHAKLLEDTNGLGQNPSTKSFLTLHSGPPRLCRRRTRQRPQRVRLRRSAGWIRGRKAHMSRHITFDAACAIQR